MKAPVRLEMKREGGEIIERERQYQREKAREKERE